MEGTIYNSKTTKNLYLFKLSNYFYMFLHENSLGQSMEVQQFALEMNLGNKLEKILINRRETEKLWIFGNDKNSAVLLNEAHWIENKYLLKVVRSS